MRRRYPATVLTKIAAGHHYHGGPQFLPNGRQFLFYTTGTPETQGVYLGSLDSQETKRLTAADAAAAYASPGWLFYIRQGTLIARRIIEARGELTGEPITVADAVGVSSLIMKLVHFQWRRSVYLLGSQVLVST